MSSSSDQGMVADGGAEICSMDNQPVALAPRYGVKGTLRVNIRIPSSCSGESCIYDQDAVASILLLAAVTQNGQAASVTATPCRYQVPAVTFRGHPPTVITTPDALVQSVRAITSSAALSGPTTCATFRSEPLPIVIGARLADPANDPLPAFSWMTDPTVKYCDAAAATPCGMTSDTACICDQDGDGKAAATVSASGVPALDDIDRIYVALRAVVTLDGAVFPPSPGQPTPGQRIKGTVTELKLDQSPIGCRRTVGAPTDCDTSTVRSVADLNPRIAPSTLQSTFVALPVPTDYTCDNLIADAPTLFRNQ